MISLETTPRGRMKAEAVDGADRTGATTLRELIDPVSWTTNMTSQIWRWGFQFQISQFSKLQCKHIIRQN